MRSSLIVPGDFCLQAFFDPRKKHLVFLWVWLKVHGIRQNNWQQRITSVFKYWIVTRIVKDWQSVLGVIFPFFVGIDWHWWWLIPGWWSRFCILPLLYCVLVPGTRSSETFASRPDEWLNSKTTWIWRSSKNLNHHWRIKSWCTTWIHGSKALGRVLCSAVGQILPPSLLTSGGGTRGWGHSSMLFSYFGAGQFAE